MSDEIFTTFEDNQALTDWDGFETWIHQHARIMEGAPFNVMLDHCPCPHCNTPIILLTWFPTPEVRVQPLELAVWHDTPLPDTLPRKLPVVMNGVRKFACINHRKAGIRS